MHHSCTFCTVLEIMIAVIRRYQNPHKYGMLKSFIKTLTVSTLQSWKPSNQSVHTTRWCCDSHEVSTLRSKRSRNDRMRSLWQVMSMFVKMTVFRMFIKCNEKIISANKLDTLELCVLMAFLVLSGSQLPSQRLWELFKTFLLTSCN